MINLRMLAAHTIYQVLQGRSLNDCLPEALKRVHEMRDQSFLQALCYGVCRWYHRLDALAHSLLKKPLKLKDQNIHCLILVGLYQLTEMRVPAHAVLDETVAAAQAFKKPWAKGLVNAVLRGYQRSAVELNEKMLQHLVTLYAHPQWIIEQVQKNWLLEWQAILTANNQHPPLALRINQKRISRASYLEKLAAHKIDARKIPETEAGIILAQPLDVQELPGFSIGEISVQDGAAQLATELLMLKPGQRVLDMCAAPGGKAAHMLEQADIELIAVDRDEKRLQNLRDNLSRLQLSATCICADATSKEWSEAKLYDRILLDAPCSASGVIRRHPDIKILRRSTDIAKLGHEQTRLLNAAWALLKPGGLLVYTTCSIFPEENTGVLQNFMMSHADAIEEKIMKNWGKACAIGRQIFPGMHEMDGFYFARLSKGYN
ncbi:MAG: rsmB [Gammaproteobacteria bacterium]|jgi:16S rRNA (cytosine967-C5)-methyltransferase|nr:rsmB [Gammaproteobacteria bacterium]